MFIHHIVTVLLLSFSWTCNFHRIGTLVMVLHDFADIPLDGAKICSYLKMQRLSNILFAILAFSWIFTRIGLLPYRVISYSTYYALDVVEMFPAYYIFNSLLCALQVLHIIWTVLILKIGYDAFSNNDGVSFNYDFFFSFVCGFIFQKSFENAFKLWFICFYLE